MLGNYVNKYINDRKNFSFVDDKESRFNKTSDYCTAQMPTHNVKTDAMSGIQSTKYSHYQPSRQSQDDIDGASHYLSAKYN